MISPTQFSGTLSTRHFFLHHLALDELALVVLVGCEPLFDAERTADGVGF
jgi:hypothetical protein